MKVAGGKGNNLFRLKKAGLRVPRWLVVTTDVFAQASARYRTEIAQLLAATSYDDQSDVQTTAASIRRIYLEAEIPEATVRALRRALATTFGSVGLFAVRSSVVDEDSSEGSFAGQMDSFLNVAPDDLLQAVKKVWASAYSARSLCYRRYRGLPAEAIQAAVIIQEMVPAARAGVLFTHDPQTGQPCFVISAAFGCGDGVVQGTADVDTYRIDWSGPAIERIPAPSRRSGGKTVLTLSDRDVRRLREVGKQIESAFGSPQDVEWAIDDRHVLYILQARPIIYRATPKRDADRRVWDNSNVVESYPGLTLPLTFSFVRQCYAVSFRKATVGFLLHRRALRDDMSIFENMIGLLDGRIYYCLLNWYRMLSYLPGFQRHRASWDQMIGITHPTGYKANRLCPVNRCYAVLMLVLRLLRVEGNAASFFRHFNPAYDEYRRLDFRHSSEEELLVAFEQLRDRFTEKWHLTLYNDFCAMKYYDWLRGLCARWIPGGGATLPNDLLCGQSGVESVRPIQALIDIATPAEHGGALSALFEESDDRLVWQRIQTDPAYRRLKEVLASYLEQFGDRGLEELKLETPTFRQSPISLVTLIREYRRRELKAEALESREGQIRAGAEETVRRNLRGRWRKVLFRFVLRNARRGIAHRENMRFARTRLFGIVRLLFRRMAQLFVTRGVLRDPADLHYLTIGEIFAFVRGGSVTQDLQAVVELRRYEYGLFAERSSAGRIETHGMPYIRPFPSPATEAIRPSCFRGIGCASGIAEGTAWIVHDPAQIPPGDDCILIARSTDPGWIFLMVQSRGIIVEKGSLLSHTAIVGRELGIPTVVGVDGATAAIRQGSRVRIDGGTGEVICL